MLIYKGLYVKYMLIISDTEVSELCETFSGGVGSCSTCSIHGSWYWAKVREI